MFKIQTKKNFLEFSKEIGKCYSLRNFEQIFTNSTAFLTPQAGAQAENRFRRLLHLKKWKLHFSLRKSAIKNFTEYNHKPRPWRSKLKELDLSYSLGNGWAIIGQNRNTQLEKFIRNIVPHIFLERVKMQLIKIAMKSEEIMRFVMAFSQLPLLTSLDLEYLGGELGDLEAISLIYQISKISQLEQLTLKIIQTPNISIQCLMAYVDTLLKMKNLKKFHLYLRRLTLSPDETCLLTMQLANLSQIKFTNHKGSIYIYKNSRLL